MLCDDQLFKDYDTPKLVPNFTVCVSALLKRDPEADTVSAKWVKVYTSTKESHLVPQWGSIVYQCIVGIVCTGTLSDASFYDIISGSR